MPHNLPQPAYNTLAPFYDAIAGDRTEDIEQIRQLIQRHSPAATSVLELACGTGAVLAGLSGIYDRWGLDLSPELLKIAQKKLPGVELVLGDMADFMLPRQFAVIYCVTDSINHLPDLVAWERLFIQVSRHLAPNGIFIFDMNTIGKLTRLASFAMGRHTTPAGNYNVKVKQIDASHFEWHLRLRQKRAASTDRLFEETIIESTYPLAEVLGAAAKHLKPLEYFAPDDATASDESDRVVFVCGRLAG